MLNGAEAVIIYSIPLFLFVQTVIYKSSFPCSIYHFTNCFFADYSAVLFTTRFYIILFHNVEYFEYFFVNHLLLTVVACSTGRKLHGFHNFYGHELDNCE